MSITFSAAQAARICNVSERTIRRMISDERLVAQPAPGPRRTRPGNEKKAKVGPTSYAITVEALRAAGLVVDMEQVRLIEATQERTPGGLLARVERVESENRSLRLRVELLERRLARQDGQEPLATSSILSSLSDYVPSTPAPAARERDVSAVSFDPTVGADGVLSKRSIAKLAQMHTSYSESHARHNFPPQMSADEKSSRENILRWLRNYLIKQHKISDWHECSDAACECHALT